MDSFELNKIIGAILGTLLFVMGVGFLAEAVYHPIEGRGPGYLLPEPELTETTAGGEVVAENVPDLGTLLASADPAAGEAAARKCTGCHNFADGAGNKQGPELYGVVGRLIGSHPGFAYSEAMMAHNAAGDMWSFENLNAFITSPKGYTPGTKMNFPGIKDPVERSNVLAYLQTLSPSPVPFPAPAPAEAAAPAEGAAPEEGSAAPAEGSVSPEGGVAADAAPESQAPAAPAGTNDGGAVATPTETQSETPVQGTPTTSGPGDGETPATDTPTAPGAQ